MHHELSINQPTSEEAVKKKLPKIIREAEGKQLELPGGGYGRRMISAPVSEKMALGIIYVDRGKSPHRWHSHDDSDRSGEYEINYPEGFEEGYIIAQGEGVVQWKEEKKIHEVKVSAGDAVYFPPGVVESQVLNNGNKPLVVVYGCTPSPRATK